MANQPRWKQHTDDAPRIQEVESVPAAPSFDTAVPPSILEALEAAPDVAVAIAEPVPLPTYTDDVEQMNSAAHKMISFLPPDAQDLIFEYQRSTDIPMWQVIAGYVMRCRENSEMFSPNVLPEWDAGISPNSLLPCRTCGTVMKPRNYGHAYCCNACASSRLKEMGGHNDDCAVVTNG